MDAEARVPGPLQVLLQAGGLLLVEGEDEDAVVALGVVLLEEAAEELLALELGDHLDDLGDALVAGEVLAPDHHLVVVGVWNSCGFGRRCRFVDFSGGEKGKERKDCRVSLCVGVGGASVYLMEEDNVHHQPLTHAP